MSDRNPFKERIKDLSAFTRVRPIRLFDSTFSIKQFVEHYLDTTFYNLTTVAQVPLFPSIVSHFFSTFSLVVVQLEDLC